MLAGMDQVAGPKLVAAVCNAGGFGTLGGARYSPKMLREMIAELKEELVDKNAPFGVDLLIPQVGGSARKTNVRMNSSELICMPRSDVGSTLRDRRGITFQIGANFRDLV